MKLAHAMQVLNIARILDMFCKEEEEGREDKIVPGEQDIVLAAAEAAPSGECLRDRQSGLDIEVPTGSFEKK